MAKGRRTPPTGLERRDLGGSSPQVTDSGRIRGLAIPFNSWTTIGSGPRSFRERVAPGAITKTLRESDTVYLDNHDPAKPIARKSAGTLQLAVTDRGLEYEAEPADTTYARDLVANVRAGNILGNSFGFEPVKDSWEWGEDGVEERTILEMKLPEVSACTFPAYEDTDIGMRDAYDRAMESRNRFYEGRAGDAPGNGKKPYGNVAYADPGYQADKKKRYPINTAAHVKAAWSYVNVAKNAAKYTSAQLAKIKAAIKAAAKKLGVTISSDDDGRTAFADMDLRSYDPLTGFPEAGELEDRDDPDGLEWAAMHEAIQMIDQGDQERARELLQNCLDETQGSHDEDSEGEAYGSEDSSGMVAHTEQGGAAVPVRTVEGICVAVPPRVLQRVYDLLREETPTARNNEAMSILEPLLDAPEVNVPSAEDGTREKPKPVSSTSAVKRESDEGAALERRWRALTAKHRV